MTAPEMAASFVVGIDLGTTNTVIAFTALSSELEATHAPQVEIFGVEQRVTAHSAEARDLLPSTLHAPLQNDGIDRPWVVGEWARARGAEVPNRVIASSKSWLAHGAVDRDAPILPWGIDDDEREEHPRLSPIDAAAEILRHARAAWDVAHPDAPLAAQEVFLTVPASFDQMARTLTLEATRRAGFPQGTVRLLEEPQAAFLDWARVVGDVGLLSLLGEDRDASSADVLVCDVGGGTTDLSLIRVTRDRNAPGGIALTRVAVGEHLLLGGDNLDIALAHRLEARFTTEGRLPPTRFAQLVLASRVAKERMLGSSDPEVTVTLLGGGARLIGGAQRTTLTRGELDEIVSGFFPEVTRDSLSATTPTRRTGLVAFGLPFAIDPAITRHVAAFLARHAPASGEGLSVSLLLNGGVFHAPTLVNRLAHALEVFTGRSPHVLPQVDPDLAVARGAVAYGLTLRGLGRRIGGGSAHGYYIGVESADDAGRKLARAVCVVPRGAEPGERVVGGPTLALVVGRVARFDLYRSDRIDRPGDVVDVDDTFAPLPPLVTAVSASAGEGEVHVALEGELTEVGTLELSCVAVGSPARRFRLAFELRRTANESRSVMPPSMSAPAAGRSRHSDLPPVSLRGADRKLEEARVRIERVYGRAQGDVDAREAKGLVRELERLLGDRATWPTSVVRPLYDMVRAGGAHRRRSIDHERVWWSLVGYLLRPGFGDPLDPPRISELAPLHAQGLSFGKEAQSSRAWWIAWRRVAGGLDEPTQSGIRDAIDPFIEPDDGRPRRKPKGVRPEPFEEVLFLASSLERLPPQRRGALGAWILERTWTSNDPNLYAAIGRIGARVPAYASAHHVVSPRLAETWLSHLLRADWREIASAPFAAVSLTRATGDRSRDVSDETRAEVVKRLNEIGARPEWVRMVREVVVIDEAQRREQFGEALPRGLRLLEG